MKIFQILPVLAFGDAVGNDTRALKDALLDAGYQTEIYAAVIDERLPEGTAQPFDMMEKVEEDDIIIYHLHVWNIRKIIVVWNQSGVGHFKICPDNCIASGHFNCVGTWGTAVPCNSDPDCHWCDFAVLQSKIKR